MVRLCWESGGEEEDAVVVAAAAVEDFMQQEGGGGWGERRQGTGKGRVEHVVRFATGDLWQDMDT